MISDWCCRWGMLVNPSKIRGMLISHSRTVDPLFPDLVIDGSVVEMVSELEILVVILYSKLAFEKQVRAIAASASRRVGILRKTLSVFREVAVVAGHSYFLCWSTVLQFGYRLPLPTYCCLIGLLAELAS